MKKFAHIVDDTDDDRAQNKVQTKNHACMSASLCSLRCSRDEHDSSHGKWHRPLIPPKPLTVQRQLTAEMWIFFFLILFWYGFVAIIIISAVRSLWSLKSSPMRLSYIQVSLCCSLSFSFVFDGTVAMLLRFCMEPSLLLLLLSSSLLLKHFSYYFFFLLSSLLFLLLLRVDRVRWL